MSTPEVYTISQVPLTAHSFSPDRSGECDMGGRFSAHLSPSAAVALSTNSNDAQIYAKDGYEWQPISTLTQASPLSITCLMSLSDSWASSMINWLLRSTGLPQRTGSSHVLKIATLTCGPGRATRRIRPKPSGSRLSSYSRLTELRHRFAGVPWRTSSRSQAAPGPSASVRLMKT